MQDRKIFGARSELSGTPALIVKAAEDCPLKATIRDLPVRKELIIEKKLPMIP